MYNDTVISGLLIFVIMYPLLSFWFLMIQRGKVGTDMTRIPSMGEEGKTIKARDYRKKSIRMEYAV